LFGDGAFATLTGPLNANDVTGARCVRRSDKDCE